MSFNPRSTQGPLALAIALAMGSGSAAWAQSDPSFNLLLDNYEPIELGPLLDELDPGQNPVFLRFEPSTGALKIRALEALLCFDYSEVAPAPRLHAGLTLPNGYEDLLNGISAAAISPGQADDSNLLYLEPTHELDCRAFPNAQLTQLELAKEARLSGGNTSLFKSTFNRSEAQPALELEIIDGRSRGATLPALAETIAYTIKVVPRDRRNAQGAALPLFVEDVRIRDYAPPVGANGQMLALSQLATITRCAINGLPQQDVDPFNPDLPPVPACSIDSNGFLRFNQFSDAAGLDMPVGAEVEFDIERTVIGSPGTPPGPVTLIAVVSASPEPDNYGSLEDAYHVFTFS